MDGPAQGQAQHAAGCSNNAFIGENTLVEPNVSVGFRYHVDCGPARIGRNGMLRQGTIIYGDVEIGNHFQSGHYTIVRAKVRMGDHCTVLNHSTLEGIIRFGDGVRIMSHVYIPTRTWFGNFVFVGPGVTFMNARLPFRAGDVETPSGATIEDEVMIGGGSNILPGVRIGARSIIAAGTVVTRNIPAGSFVAGVPGRIKPLPPHLAQLANRKIRPFDLWHPLTPDLATLEWPESWGEKFRRA